MKVPPPLPNNNSKNSQKITSPVKNTLSVTLRKTLAKYILNAGQFLM